jgi:hypothetical protein
MKDISAVNDKKNFKKKFISLRKIKKKLLAS